MTHSTNPSNTHVARLHHHRQRVHQAHASIAQIAAETVATHYDHKRAGGAGSLPASTNPTAGPVTPPTRQ